MSVDKQGVSKEVEGEMKIIHIGYPKAGSTFIQDEILSRSPDIANIISEESLCFDWIEDSPQESCAVKAKMLYEQHPDARIIIISRNTGEWLESWWRHQTRSLTPMGLLPLHKAMKTEFFERCIAPHLYHVNISSEFRKYFDDVRVIPFRLLKKDTPEFVRLFCEYADIDIPQGVRYRVVNFSRSHIWCWTQMVINSAWVGVGPRKYDSKYLYFMKHYVSRLDGLKRIIKRLIGR